MLKQWAKFFNTEESDIRKRGGRPRKYDYDKVYRLYKDGITIKEIAKQFECNLLTVKNILKTFDIKFKKRQYNRNSNRKRIKKKKKCDIEKITNLHIINKLNVTQISRETKRSWKYVNNILKKAGILKKTPKYKYDQNEIVRLHTEDKISIEEISKQINASSVRIREILIKAGVFKTNKELIKSLRAENKALKQQIKELKNKS